MQRGTRMERKLVPAHECASRLRGWWIDQSGYYAPIGSVGVELAAGDRKPSSS